MNALLLDTIQMVPDGSVTWGCYDVPGMAGRLYLSTSARRSTGRILLQHAQAGAPWESHAGKLTGQWGRIRRVGDLAIKLFHTFNPSKRSVQEGNLEAGLPALRVSVAMHEGFKRVQRDQQAAAGHVRFAAPEMFGAFIADGYDMDAFEGRAPVVWAMSYEAGVSPPDFNQIMPIEKRHTLYRKALASCGIGNLEALYLGDDTGRNAFVDTERNRVVRFDFMARTPIFDYFDSVALDGSH